MVTRAAKDLLRNTIRNTDYHNRLLEEEEMWRHWETEKGLTMMVTDDYLRRRMRMDEYSKPGHSNVRGPQKQKCDVKELQKQKQAARVSQKGQSNFWMRKLMETEEKDPDRWGHSGYKELYPEEFKQSSTKRDRSSSSASEGLRSQRPKCRRRNNRQSASTSEPRWDHGGYRELYPEEFKSRSSAADRLSGSPTSEYSSSPKAKSKKKRKRHSRKKSKKHKKSKKKVVPVITISDSSEDKSTTTDSEDYRESYRENDQGKSQGEKYARRRSYSDISNDDSASTVFSSGRSSARSRTTSRSRSSWSRSRSTSRSDVASRSSSASTPPSASPSSSRSAASSSPPPSYASSPKPSSCATSDSNWVESDTSETLLETRRDYLKRKLKEVAAAASSEEEQEYSDDNGASRNSTKNKRVSDLPVRKRLKLEPPVPIRHRKLKSHVVRENSGANRRFSAK